MIKMTCFSCKEYYKFNKNAIHQGHCLRFEKAFHLDKRARNYNEIDSSSPACNHYDSKFSRVGHLS